MKIYTKTGDAGMTSLWGHGDVKRVPKDDPRVEIYGTIDEANAIVGIARSFLESQKTALCVMLDQIQNTLFSVGADLSNVSPDRQDRFHPVEIKTMEQWIDQLEEHLPALTQFILPSGHLSAAFLHQARTVVRRAERRLVPYVNVDGSYAEHLKYLNRLSDFLFVAAREANRLAGIEDTRAEF